MLFLLFDKRVAVCFMALQVSQQSLYECACINEVGTLWDRIVFFTADIHYGGRVTDQMDQRLLKSLLKRCFAANNPESETADPALKGYVLPSDYCYKDIAEFAMCLPADPAPEILGLDPGAAVVYASKKQKITLNLGLSTACVCRIKSHLVIYHLVYWRVSVSQLQRNAEQPTPRLPHQRTSRNAGAHWRKQR